MNDTSNGMKGAAEYAKSKIIKCLRNYLWISDGVHEIWIMDFFSSFAR
jgi:hypothetical protein